jgi:hypothetical protein
MPSGRPLLRGCRSTSRPLVQFYKREILPVCIKKVVTLEKSAQFAVCPCYAGSIVTERVDRGSHLSCSACALTNALFSIASEALSNLLLLLSALQPRA